MRQSFRVLIAVLLSGALLPDARPASASLTSFTISKCLAGKLKLVGKGAAAQTSCRAKHAATPDAAKLATCLAKASDKLMNGFAKLNGKYPFACPGGTSDVGPRAADSASFGGQISADAGSALGGCDGPKQKCVGKYVATVLGCYAKAATKGGSVDGACLAKASAKLADGAKGCLDKAAAAGGCTTAGNQLALLGGGADTFADAQGCLLDPAAGGCGSVACPSTIEFSPDGSASASRVDLGWTGLAHGRPSVTGGTLTVAVTGPSGSDCAFTGPVANLGADAGALDNQRCTGDTSVQCANAPGGTGGPCTGLGTCEFYWGPPHALNVGGVGVCVVDQVVGTVSGTVNPASGAVTRDLAVERTAWLGGGDTPCPRCLGDAVRNDGVQGGTCESGDRMGLPCDGNGTIQAFPDSGTTSLDCPATSGTSWTTSYAMTGTTGTSSLLLGPGSPDCKDPFTAGKKCACDTCNNVTRNLCSDHAHCPTNDGHAGICGGRTCFGGAEDGLPCRTCYGGANDGGVCSSTSACPGGTCTRPSCSGGAPCFFPGEATAPNACVDDTTTPAIEGACSDTGIVGDHVGSCTVGPIASLCQPSSGHPQRSCTVDEDCCDDAPVCLLDPPTPGDCGAELRGCFLDGGSIGNAITADGATDPPGGTIAQPTIVQTFCAAPTSISAVNTAFGFPGPNRIQQSEQMRLRP